MENFTPFTALAGGALIGVAASMMLLLNGRIAGISGIVGGLLPPTAGDVAWRVSFVGGLLVGGLLLGLAFPWTIAASPARSLLVTGIGGLVVGFGVRMGGGCTSGHGVCGISRVSPRSLVATGSFVGFGMVVASAIEMALGGTL